MTLEFFVIVLLFIFIIFTLITLNLTNKLKKAEKSIYALNLKHLQEKEEYVEKFNSEIQLKNKNIAELEQEKIKSETNFKLQLDKSIKEARKKSNNIQRNVIKGKIGENFAPFMNGFTYNPSDCQFLGQPIDFIIFHNLHRCSDKEIGIDEVSIIFAEIKTGESNLNTRQKILKQAIENGQVKFETFRVDDNYPPNISCENQGSNTQNRDIKLKKLNTTLIDNKNDNNDWTSKEENELLAYFEKGYSLWKIGSVMHRSETSLRHKLKEHGKLK